MFVECAVFQQLEIDYIIGGSHKELLPNWSGPAAILRIFGVTREGKHFTNCPFTPGYFKNIVSVQLPPSAFFINYKT